MKDKKARGFFALKAMKIPDVLRLKQEQHVHNEKEVLTEVKPSFPCQTVSEYYTTLTYRLQQKCEHCLYRYHIKIQ